MPRSIRKLCTQDVLASATWLPCSRQSPAWSLRHGPAGHVQSARDVTRPADPRRRGGLRQGQASTAAKEAEARRRAADPQGTAGLRRRVGRLLCRYTRPSVYPAAWTTEPRGRSPGRPARSGRLRRAVLRTGLQRVSTHDDVQMSVSLRLVLPRWLRRLSRHRERAGVQVTQPTDVTVAAGTVIQYCQSKDVITATIRLHHVLTRKKSCCNSRFAMQVLACYYLAGSVYCSFTRRCEYADSGPP